MRRLMQSVNGGEIQLVDHPDISFDPTSLRVDVRASLVSSGTERSMHELASSSLLQKARARPDLVRAVVDRARRDGIQKTIGTVRSRLDEEIPVGYSASGIVTGVGEGVSGFRVGDRVATAGVGHAEMQMVPGNLAARLPDAVSFDEGAFGAIASVALHGLRLADIGPGSKVVVIGLGLVGQIAARLALASGCDVAGTDINPSKVDIAVGSGAFGFPSSEEGELAVNDWTGGPGADAVLVTAATKSSDPMHLASSVARDRATIVAVGDVGLNLNRRPLYEKELTIKVSRAYGPGRYDPVYESLGIDYPIGFVRWPIGRNLEAVMSLLESGWLDVSDLITHRFPFENAVEAYDVFDGGDPYLGILLEYEPSTDTPHVALLRRSAVDATHAPGLKSALVGAGRFASGVLLPYAKNAGFGPWTKIASEGGASAVRVGEKHGFDVAVSTSSDVATDPDIDVVFVASRHDSHATIVSSALVAGKHVFCEKPLAITTDELDRVVGALNSSSGILMVGFNRRWSPAVRSLVDFIGRSGPIQIAYRVHAGALPNDHWLKDRRQGGRLLGEACHFIDTCDAIAGEAPDSVYAVGSGVGELLLEEDFTITLSYPTGSQAVIVYSAGAPHRAGKERIEAIRGDRSAVIDDFRSLTMHSSQKTDVARYKPQDKGHQNEFDVFRDAIEGRHGADDLATSAVDTSRAALAAVESLMTGEAIRFAL